MRSKSSAPLSPPIRSNCFTTNPPLLFGEQLQLIRQVIHHGPLPMNIALRDKVQPVQLLQLIGNLMNTPEVVPMTLVAPTVHEQLLALHGLKVKQVLL